jgi:hypothetical protein
MTIVKALSITALVAVVAGLFAGCFIETRHPHRYYERPVVVVPVRR